VADGAEEHGGVVVVEASDGVAKADGGANGEAGGQLENSAFASGAGRSPLFRAVMAASQSMSAIRVRVRAPRGVSVIQTTSAHLFWDPDADKFIPADHLRTGEHLKTPDGTLAVADGGTTPKDYSGDVGPYRPGNADHDFYVTVATTAVLVHNRSLLIS
jgi:hypothetical protein